MVVNDDPGLKAYLASDASAQAKAQRYLVLMTRSRFDVYPPVNASPTGTHSAVFVPDRPAQVRGNTKGRPAYVWLSDENGGCPLNYARIVSVESEITPIMVGAFAIPDNQLEECLDQATTEPNGQPRQQVAQQNHNPTVFKNLVFTTWYGHGLRAIDISRPQTPREVGYAMPAPQGIARTYPVFKDGLIYWADNNTGLHVARYTGPRSNELPGPGSGVYEGNSTSPHRVRYEKNRAPFRLCWFSHCCGLALLRRRVQTSLPDRRPRGSVRCIRTTRWTSRASVRDAAWRWSTRRRLMSAIIAWISARFPPS